MDKKLSKKEIMDRLLEDDNFQGSVSSVIKSLFPEPKPVETREVKIFRCDEHHPEDGTRVVGFDSDMNRISEDYWYDIVDGFCFWSKSRNEYTKSDFILYWCEL